MTDVMIELDKIWHLQYGKLLEFKRQNGHSVVPQVYEQDKAFGRWVNTQRTFHRNSRLQQGRKELLDEIEFVWKVDLAGVSGDAENWHLQYEKLVQFKQKNDHCSVPIGYKQDPYFGRWADAQRKFHANKKMQPDREALLDEIGFLWKACSASDMKWHQQYKKLVQYQRQHEHCRVPIRYEKDAHFGNWIQRQRSVYNDTDKKMIPHREGLLNEIGFVWKLDRADKYATRFSDDDKKWRQHYAKLVEFQRENGHCIVSKAYKENAYLCRWVNRQRNLRNDTKKKMLPDREELLNEIGFVWKVDRADKYTPRVAGDDKKWHQQYEKLLQFQREHEHCHVPIKYKEDAYLGAWVHRQRQWHNDTEKKMLPHREELLNEIGFVWTVDHADKCADHVSDDDKKWHQQYEKLVEFQRQHEHCLVPVRYKDDLSLHTWVNTQRTALHNTKKRMLPHREKLLNEIGFVWKVDRARVFEDDEKWHQQYERLVEFQRQHEHCRVPIRYKGEIVLGNWVKTQRNKYNNDTLRLDRKNLLSELGVVWKGQTLAIGHSSATTDDVSGLVLIHSFHASASSFF